MSGGRASFAGRGSQISLAAFGDTGPSGPAPGIFSTFPANVTQIETGASSPACAALPGLPHHLQRRQPLRIPGRDVDGGTPGGRRRGARARGQPEAAAGHGRPADEGDRLAHGGMDDRARLGDPERRGCGAAGPRAGTGHHRRRAPAGVGSAAGVQAASSPCGGGAATCAPPGIRPAGIESYAVYVRRGGSYKLLATTDANRYRYRGRRGKRYSFHVRARDRAGNVEARAEQAGLPGAGAPLAATYDCGWDYTWLDGVRTPDDPAGGAARILRGRRPGGADRREGARPVRPARLRAQGDRAQQARGREPRAARARSSSRRRPRCPRARPSSSPRTASPRRCTRTPRRGA